VRVFRIGEVVEHARERLVLHQLAHVGNLFSPQVQVCTAGPLRQELVTHVRNAVLVLMAQPGRHGEALCRELARVRGNVAKAHRSPARKRGEQRGERRRHARCKNALLGNVIESS
jgi:hypothetical protein